MLERAKVLKKVSQERDRLQAAYKVLYSEYQEIEYESFISGFWAGWEEYSAKPNADADAAFKKYKER